MVGLKTANPKVRNVDLIHTYYSGKKTPSKKEVIIYKGANKFHIGLNILLAFFSLVVVAVISFTVVNQIYLKRADRGVLTLFPLRHIGEIPSYNYNLIKNKPAAVVLKLESRPSIISFKTPKDLTKATITFSAKGEQGNEKIAVILRDTNMLSNANPDDIITTSPLPNKDWQSFSIKLKELNLPLDKSRITQIRFDAREALTKVENGGNVYIKDIQID